MHDRLTVFFILATAWLNTANALPSGPITLNGISDSTISGLEISNPDGNGITLTSCQDIRIEYCTFDSCTGEGIYLYNCSNITVVRNMFNDIRSGVYAVDCQSIAADSNYFKNVQGPFPRGQFVQYDKVTGPGCRINYNVGENILGESYAEDAVNLYKSSGLAGDPIQVFGNKIRGGGPSGSGGGIMTGDAGCAYIIARDNILVDPGQYGIAVAGGHDIQLKDNLVYGKQQSFTNVGLYVWDQYQSDCRNITVTGNRVNWTNKDGNPNPAWNGDNCGQITGWDDNEWGADIDAGILPEDLKAWYDSAYTDTGSTGIGSTEFPGGSTQDRMRSGILNIQQTTVSLQHSMYNVSGQKIMPGANIRPGVYFIYDGRTMIKYIILNNERK